MLQERGKGISGSVPTAITYRKGHQRLLLLEALTPFPSAKLAGVACCDPHCVMHWLKGAKHREHCEGGTGRKALLGVGFETFGKVFQLQTRDTGHSILRALRSLTLARDLGGTHSNMSVPWWWCWGVLLLLRTQCLTLTPAKQLCM